MFMDELRCPDHGPMSYSFSGCQWTCDTYGCNYTITDEDLARNYEQP